MRFPSEIAGPDNTCGSVRTEPGVEQFEEQLHREDAALSAVPVHPSNMHPRTRDRIRQDAEYAAALVTDRRAQEHAERIASSDYLQPVDQDVVRRTRIARLDRNAESARGARIMGATGEDTALP